MGKNSLIGWCDHTFNPWIGCSKVSAGCKFCYAEHLMDHRFGKVKWGDHGERVRTSEANWKQPLKWNRECEKSGTRARVFCGSLCDVFEDREDLIPIRRDLFELIWETPNLDWLLLTKRPENIWKIWPDRTDTGTEYGDLLIPVPNVWLGCSVENQEMADKRIPELLKYHDEASVLFLSCEPLLEKIDLSRFFWIEDAMGDLETPGLSMPIISHRREVNLPCIDWVIVGGESGDQARPFNSIWSRDLLYQCKEAYVPFFMKQLGSNSDIRTFHKKGEDIDEFPEDLRVRQFPKHKEEATI